MELSTSMSASRMSIGHHGHPSAPVFHALHCWPESHAEHLARYLWHWNLQFRANDFIRQRQLAAHLRAQPHHRLHDVTPFAVPSMKTISPVSKTSSRRVVVHPVNLSLTPPNRSHPVIMVQHRGKWTPRAKLSPRRIPSRRQQGSFPCRVCDKHFTREWLLTGHQRTHTGVKPFHCRTCPKSFADKSNLRAHMQTHSEAKPYWCERCGKRFKLKSYLSKHKDSTCERTVILSTMRSSGGKTIQPS